MRSDKITIPRDKIKELYLDKRLSLQKIAKMFNCNPETIRRRLIEFSIGRRFHEIKLHLPKEELKKLYIEDKKSTIDLAKKYGCSQWTVLSNLKRKGIPTRMPTDFLKWKGPANQINPQINNSLNISYILGVLLGDGWVYNYKNNYFIGLDTIEYSFCKSFFDSLKSINLNPNIFRKGKYWRTIASSKLFYKWFKNLEFKKIEEISLNHPIYFLKGIYESEGCLSINYDKRVNKGYLILVIVSCNEKTINLTKLLIENLGLRPRLNLRNPSNPNKKPLWVLNLGRQDEIQTFLNIVKPVIKNKPKV